MASSTTNNPITGEVTVVKKKHTARKVFTAIIAIILIIAIAATIFIGVVTRKQKDTDKNVKYIGDMLTSDTVEYGIDTDSAKGIRHNPVIKIGEMIWYFCASGDAAKHAKQTPPEVEIKKDIPYINDGNLYHKYDVFYPNNMAQGEKLPVIIDIHGGGWMYATKDLNEYYCRAMADRGYVVISMSYRLVPDVTVKEQLNDVMTALGYIKEHMSEYQCDTDNIMLTGDSAGGMMAAYSTVFMQSPELCKTFDVPYVDMKLTALLLTSPVAFMKDGALSVYTKPLWGKDYRTSNTYKYMNFDEIIDYASDFPPTYLITSDGDSLAHDQTIKMAKLLNSKGIDTTLKNYPDYKGKSLPHVFSILEPFDEIGSKTIDDSLAFYDKQIAAKSTNK